MFAQTILIQRRLVYSTSHRSESTAEGTQVKEGLEKVLEESTDGDPMLGRPLREPLFRNTCIKFRVEHRKMNQSGN